MNSVESLHMMDDVELVKMRFGSQEMVNVVDLIYTMHGDRMPKLTDDQWQETRERCADVMEEFLFLRREVADLERNLKFYVREYNDLKVHFLQTHGRQAYREFRVEMDERHAEDERKKKLASKPAYKTHMWIKGNK